MNRFISVFPLNFHTFQSSSFIFKLLQAWEIIQYFFLPQASSWRGGERQPSNRLVASESRCRSDSGHLLWTHASQTGPQRQYEGLPHRSVFLYSLSLGKKQTNWELEKQLWMEGWRLVFARKAQAWIIIAYDALNKGWILHWCDALRSFFWSSTHLQNRTVHVTLRSLNETFHSVFHLNSFKGLWRALVSCNAPLKLKGVKWLVRHSKST